MLKYFRQFLSRNRQNPREVRTMAESQLDDMKNAPSNSEERKKFDDKNFEKSRKSSAKGAPTDQSL